MSHKWTPLSVLESVISKDNSWVPDTPLQEVVTGYDVQEMVYMKWWRETMYKKWSWEIGIVDHQGTKH